MTYLFDTDVLIDYFKKQQYAIDLVTALIHKADLATSVIVVAELRVGWNEKEAATYLPILHTLFPSVGITNDIAELGGKFRRDYQTKGKAILLPDALIAATAIHHNLTLLTRNTKDFPMPELQMVKADSFSAKG